MIQCAVQHKKIVQNNEVVTFLQWMEIWLNDKEGGMKDQQTNKQKWFFEQNHSALIQCEVQHKKIVQNNEVVTFSQWMVIRLNDEEGGMKDHQTIIIIYSQLLKLSRVKSNFHFWRPPQCSAGDANLPLPNFPGREKNIVFTVLYGLATFVKREHKSI